VRDVVEVTRQQVARDDRHSSRRFRSATPVDRQRDTTQDERHHCGRQVADRASPEIAATPA
jgi:hypothetical protein